MCSGSPGSFERPHLIPWQPAEASGILSLMSARARKMFKEALQLPLPERAELAADLIASLDGEPDEDVEAAWAAEIERRAKDAIAHPDDDVPWETVRAELKAGRLADE